MTNRTSPYTTLALRPHALNQVIQSILSVLYTSLPLHLYNLHPAQQATLIPWQDIIDVHTVISRANAITHRNEEEHTQDGKSINGIHRPQTLDPFSVN